MVKHIYQQYNSLKEGEKEYLKLNPHHAIAIKEAMHFVIVIGLRC